MRRRTIHLIAAARPNFMKVAPLYHALAEQSWCVPQVVHAGQHYDASMSDAFFRDLRLPEPVHHLEVGSGTHAEQTGRTMIAYETVCRGERPDAVVVVGDVNATAACAMVGAKSWIPVIHLEAGLRSGDRHMPEEINRLVTDALSDLLLTPSPDADSNLRAEGVPAHKIQRVGNIMIDSFEMLRQQIEASSIGDSLGLAGRPYAVATFHRPSNVDQRETLAALVTALVEVARQMPVVFPVHPRTRRRLEDFGLSAFIHSQDAIMTTAPLGYVEFMRLILGCTLAITDSGGVQEETTYLRIPCATLRENTERPITITEGSNRLLRVEEIADAARAALEGRWPLGHPPDLWDGHTAQRTTESLRRHLT